MLITKRRNANGTIGRCSCAKSSSFKVGDKVAVVHYRYASVIGETGTVTYVCGTHVSIVANDHYAGNELAFEPACFRKLS